MKIILAMVLSVDGKSTKHDLPDQSWASSEDQKHLSKLVSENNLILMGGRTYELAKSHIKPSEAKLRIVVTHNPEKFSADKIDGQLEFVNGSVREIVGDLEDKGYKQMLLLSGENLNKEFFENNLIDEIYLTVEPKIFGSGKGVVAESNLDINLQLMEIEKLNEQGTLLFHYKVIQ
jgi:dihydrofolate reductase